MDLHRKLKVGNKLDLMAYEQELLTQHQEEHILILKIQDQGS